MPSTQPRGTHAFDPGSSSHQVATQALNIISAGGWSGGPIGPPLNSDMDNEPLAHAPVIPPFITSSIASFLPLPPGASLSSWASSSVVSPPLLPLGASLSSSVVSPPLQVLPLSAFSLSSSDGTMPPPSSSLGPTDHLHPKPDISMSSAVSQTSSSRKHKLDARSTSGMPPPSKRMSKPMT
jgi:hypothetical protein